MRVLSCISSLDLLTWMRLYVEESSKLQHFVVLYGTLPWYFFGFSNAAMASLVMAQTLIMVSVFFGLRQSFDAVEGIAEWGAW